MRDVPHANDFTCRGKRTFLAGHIYLLRLRGLSPTKRTLDDLRRVSSQLSNIICIAGGQTTAGENMTEGGVIVMVERPSGDGLKHGELPLGISSGHWTISLRLVL